MNKIEIMKENKELIEQIKKEEPNFEPCELFNTVLWGYSQQFFGFKIDLCNIRRKRETLQEYGERMV